METTSNKQNGQVKSQYKAINLKYEYEGYTGRENWAIISELSEKELFEKYPDEMSAYVPFVLLSVEQGNVIQEYIRREDRYRKQHNNREDFFGYDEGLTEALHSEAVVPDFVEQQEMEDYYNERDEKKMQLIGQAMSLLTEKQHKYLAMRYLDNKTAAEIAREEGVAPQVIRRHILAAIKKFEKIFAGFFRK